MNTQPHEESTGTVQIRMADTSTPSSSGDVQEQKAPSNGENTLRENTPLPSINVSDTRRTEVQSSDGQRRTSAQSTSDTVGQNRVNGEQDVGHDVDLPARGDRHSLTTYEAAKLFEEAECRVSERTIIRWCNKNKRGVRRLVCAFEPIERKYYIDEESVKAVILEERDKGRQSQLYTPDLSDINSNVSDEPVRQSTDSVGQQPTASDTVGGQTSNVTDNVGQEHQSPAATEVKQELGDDAKELGKENMRLQIENATLREQAHTKDEMMTYLRKEIDRRVDQTKEDRETFEQSLVWFRAQVETKDRAIEHLNTQMRGLLEAPKTPPPSESGEPSGTTGHEQGRTHDNV